MCVGGHACVCLAGAVDNVADPGRCNPKVPSSIPGWWQGLSLSKKV